MGAEDSFTDKISLELEKNSIVINDCRHVGMLSIKTANKSVEDALKLPDPVDLYYGLLNDGEVACLFADSNAGKSGNRKRLYATPAKFDWQRKKPQNHKRLLYWNDKKKRCVFYKIDEVGRCCTRKRLLC